MYTIYIPYILFIYSMYIYNYIHILRGTRNVINSPANNYVLQQKPITIHTAQGSFLIMYLEFVEVILYNFAT